MGVETGIKWTDSTFNPWWGCTKVSPGCDNCYAEAWDKRTGGTHWGKSQPRKMFGEKHWKEPLKWDRDAMLAGKRHRVFCASMADVFDKEAPPGQRDKLWELIRNTPNLDWQILTKRPERIAKCLPPDWGEGYPNVWLGCTAEDQKRLEQRVPHLLAVPAVVHFISAEPLLECLDLTKVDPVDWVIVGGESGAGARSFGAAWARSMLKQCKKLKVAAFMKQLGADAYEGTDDLIQIRTVDRKGGDFDDPNFPDDIKVRDFPQV